jgi:hypothetical protein
MGSKRPDPRDAFTNWLHALGRRSMFSFNASVLASRGIAAGQRWNEALQKAAHRCEVVIALISSDALLGQGNGDLFCQGGFLAKGSVEDGFEVPSGIARDVFCEGVFLAKGSVEDGFEVPSGIARDVFCQGRFLANWLLVTWESQTKPHESVEDGFEVPSDTARDIFCGPKRYLLDEPGPPSGTTRPGPGFAQASKPPRSTCTLWSDECLDIPSDNDLIGESMAAEAAHIFSGRPLRRPSKALS